MVGIQREGFHYPFQSGPLEMVRYSPLLLGPDIEISQAPAVGKEQACEMLEMAPPSTLPKSRPDTTCSTRTPGSGFVDPLMAL